MTKPHSIRDRVSNDLKFLKGWVKQPKSVGSIKPTSKQAADLMASFIPSESDLPILELGPGTGPITKAILETGISPSRLVSVEYNDEFFCYLKKTFSDVQFVQGDAFNLDGTLHQFKGQKFSAILSGLPLLNFPLEKRKSFIRNGMNWLAPGAPFVQLCYGPKAPVKLDPARYTLRHSKWVLSNVPPARFWIYEELSRE